MALLVPAALVLLCYSYFILHRLVSLRKVPAAHWSSRFTSARILWARWTGDELKYLIDAHSRLGPIVLVGPKELSVSSYQDGIRKVYDAGFSKPAAFYSMFNYYGACNAFTSLNKSEHGIRRRRTAALYSKSALMHSKHLAEVTECIIYDRLLPKLESLIVGNDRLDALDLRYRVCNDHLTSFSFGQCNGTNFLSCSSKEKPEVRRDDPLQLWRLHYENLSCRETFFVQEMPGLYRLSKSFGINLLPKRYFEATEYLQSWMSALADKADRTIASKQSKGVALEAKDEPVIYEAVKEAVKNDSPHLSLGAQEKQVKSEIFDHVCTASGFYYCQCSSNTGKRNNLAASREVLGLVFGYTLYYLATHPSAQHKLHAELREHKINMSRTPNNQPPSPPSNPSQLSTLPYLRAIINEPLRLRPRSTPLPRTTPHGRSVSIAGIDNIPPNTRINSFQWFVHRDPAKWQNVDDWEPERWLSRGRNHDREDVLWPFASGPRMCLGSHWTYYFMQHVLAAVCERFVFGALPPCGERLCAPGSPGDELPIRIMLRI